MFSRWSTQRILKKEVLEGGCTTSTLHAAFTLQEVHIGGADLRCCCALL